MFAVTTMAALKGLCFKKDKHLIFSIALVLLCLNSLGQTTALISGEESSGPYAPLKFETFSGVQVLGAERFIADGNKIDVYSRSVHNMSPQESLRGKRDIREIIAQQNLTFPPEVVRRTREALQGIQGVTAYMKKIIENPPVNGTTAAPENTTTVLPGSSTVAPNTTANGESTTTIPPATSSPAANETSTTTTTSEPPPINTTTTPEPLTIATSESPPTTISSSTTTTSSSPPTTSRMASARDTPSSIALADMSRAPAEGNRKSEFSGRSIMATPVKGKLSEQSDVKTRFSVSEAIVSLQIALNASERVMMDRLSAETVIVLEESFASLREINESMPVTNLDEEKEKFLFWVNYLLLSVKHSLQRMKDEERASGLLSKADDITIVITAAFCLLAIIFAGLLFAYSFKSRKEHRGNYKIDKGPQKSNLRNNPSRNPDSSSDQNSGDPNSFFSIPSGVTVQTRSNPMYSSHRSVDVERAPTTSPLDKFRYGESRGDDSARSAGERNSNGRDRSAASPSADSSVTSFREPGRNRDKKYDAAKDNEGFLDDDAVGVRTDSESVL